MFKSALKSLLLCAVLSWASLAHAFPACASALSDPDGDGWGWENNRSCKVVTGAFPLCSSAAVDPDGDGWGWENNKSCVVVGPSSSSGTNGSGTVSSAFAITDNMGAGWNLGNTLDAFGGETNWGNPYTTKAMIDTVRRAGFKTLRIPVTWDDFLSGSGYTISASRLNRVEEVAKYGLDNGMYVIINVHHHNGWYAPYYGNESYARDKLTKIWKQLSDRFRNHDNHLIFETMNEPHVGDDWWGTQENFNVVNNLNAEALKTIRGTGGNNSTRLVMLPGFAASAHDYHLNAVRLPDDKFVALSVHAYWPFDFSMQLNGANVFDNQRNIDDLFNSLNTRFVSKGIPVVMGEWASTDKNNLGERIRHAEYYARAAKRARIPTVWWDNGNFTAYSQDAMGLLNRSQNRWVHQGIVDAIVRGSQ